MRRGLTISLVFFSLILHANPDSLLLELSNATTSAERIDVLNKLSHYYIKYNFRKSIEYGNEALNKATEENYQYGLGQAHLNLGWNYWQNAYYPDAYSNLILAKGIFAEIKDVENQAETNRIIGLLYHYTVKIDSAIKYLELASTQFQAIGDSINLALTLTELSFAVVHTGDIEKSNQLAVKAHVIKLTSESIRIQFHTWSASGNLNQVFQNELIVRSLIPELQSQREKAIQSGNLYEQALVGSELGNFFQMLGNVDSALFYHKISEAIYGSLNEGRRRAYELMDIAECFQNSGNDIRSEPLLQEANRLLIAEGNLPGVTITLDDLGKIALRSGRYSEALKLFNRAHFLADSLGHGIDVIRFLRRKSDVYRSTGKFDDAILAAHESYEKASEIGTTHHIMWGAEKLYLAYEAKGDFENAYSYLKIHDAYALQRVRDQMSKENLEFQTLFELNEKSRQIDVLNKENVESQARIDLQRSYLIFSVLGVLITLIFAVVLYDRMRKVRHLNGQVLSQNSLLQEMNTEKELLLKEIHHRVKNNLQMISSIIGMQKRRIDQSDAKMLFNNTQGRLKSIGLIHEHLYRTDSFSTINLQTYVKDLVNTILISYQDKTKPITQIEVPEFEVAIDTAIPIGLIITELVTNAFKYAFDKTDHPTLYISIQESCEELNLLVRDNGTGGSIGNSGFGWTIIKSMVSSLDGTIETNSDEGLEIKISLTDYELTHPELLGDPA